MSLLQLSVGLVVVLVVSRFVLAPLVGRGSASIQTASDVGRLAWGALFRFVSNLCFWSLIAVGVVGLTQLAINQTGGVDVETVKQSHLALDQLKATLGTINDGLARGVAGALMIGLGLWTFLQVRRRGRLMLVEAYQAEIDRLLAAKAANQWEQLPPSEAMGEVEEKIRAKMLAIQERGDREDDPERERLEQELARLLAAHELLDVQRRLNVRIDPMDLGRRKAQGLGERLATLFVSEGLVNTLGGAARVLAVVLNLLLIPSLLVLTAAPIADAAEERQAQLAQQLHRLELQLAVDDLQRDFEATLEAAADAQATELESQEVGEEASSEEDGLTASDLQAVRHLARIFEAEVFPNGLGGRIATSADGPDAQLIRRSQARQNVLRTAAAFVGDEQAPLRVNGGLDATPEERQAARLLERGSARPGPVTSIGTRAEQRFAELARSQPSFWRGVRHMLDDYAHSFARPATAQQIRGLLVSQAIGEAFDRVSFDSPVADLSRKAMANLADETGTRLFDVQYQRFVVEMSNARSLDEAIKATVERRLPIFTASETARLHAATEALPDERRLAEALGRRPPSLARMSEVHVNAAGAQRTLADIARRLHGGQPPANFADALSSFDDYFPGLEGQERRTERYRAQTQANLVREPARVQSTASRRNFSRSRSYVQLRGFSRIGGVLLGRMPESGGSLDIRDLNWTLVDKELWLELRSADGGTQSLGPYPAAIAHLALAYAADGRPTTVTMVRADPLPELKILLHPALVDTSLGCRATRLDQFVDEFSGEIEELGTLRADATREAVAEIALYEYAWAARFLALSQADASAEILLPYGFADALSPRATEIINNEATKEYVQAALAGGGEVENLEAKHEFFDRRAVDHIKACRTANDVEVFGQCVSAEARQQASLYANDPTASWGAPPPTYEIWSGVREHPYDLDPKLDFVRSEGKPSLWPLDFVVQIAFTSPPWFVASDAAWYDEDNAALESYVDISPFEIEEVRQALRQALEDAALAKAGDPLYEHATILSDMTDFTVLQRLFRLGFEGRLGEAFPVEALSELAQATGPLLPPSAPTLRWNPRTASLEYALLEELAAYDDAVLAGAAPEDAAAITSCRTWLGQLADGGPLALAGAPQDSWEQTCAFELADPTLSPLAEVAEQVTLIRRLRHHLGVPVDDRLLAERDQCSAAF